MGTIDLERLTSAPRVRTAKELFDTLDAEAIEAQAKFKKAMTRANQMVLVAGISGGLLLASGVLAARFGDEPDWSWLSWLPVLFGVVGGIAGAIATTWLHSARHGDELERWMRKRADAETARRDFFLALVREPVPADMDTIEVALAKLRHVRTQHVEDQRNWFDKRAREHRASADRTLRLGSIAAGLGAVAAFAAGIAAIADTTATALGAFTVVGASLATFATTREEIHQDRRNAERYESARDALTKLLGKIGEVETDIQGGTTVAVEVFVAAVHEQLLAEHQQWLASEARVADTMKRLEDNLAAQRQATRDRHAPPIGAATTDEITGASDG